MWGLTSVFQRVFRGRDVTTFISVLCIALYILALLFDPAGALRARGPFAILSPSASALVALGATGAPAWAFGQWWTLITAIYLHGSVLHILFNVLWIRQLGPAVDEVYGAARLIVVFTVAGATGFALSVFAGHDLTVGASGSIFGLLAALIAYGHRRGGLFGRLVARQYGQWALILFIFGLLPGSSIDNWAHAGGFIGGFVAGWILSFERRESGLDRMLAAACIAITVASFALALWTAFVG
jgi:membrane associated rhomboid family serine protease